MVGVWYSVGILILRTPILSIPPCTSPFPSTLFPFIPSTPLHSILAVHILLVPAVYSPRHPPCAHPPSLPPRFIPILLSLSSVFPPPFIPISGDFVLCVLVLSPSHPSRPVTPLSIPHGPPHPSPSPPLPAPPFLCAPCSFPTHLVHPPRFRATIHPTQTLLLSSANV
ncbi:hypothetical protein B0H17DRAFT_1219430 [Mycena rosella]|uniref:Uncharacterized protein n=1 Tax=Mycena rosella TaxID=1033263 RepID=A0AAD7FFA0_MYCRO|nr:hypothetical protein B0H17DRAFT_1219430 [Mycena rosella]